MSGKNIPVTKVHATEIYGKKEVRLHAFKN
jgi:hypothetical protein